MSENTNVTLNHPTIVGLAQSVPADAVDDWKEAGWLDVADEAPKPGSKDDLVNQAEQLGLDTSGNKADLEARIAAYKAEHGDDQQ